jgi:hypothetical protein
VFAKPEFLPIIFAGKGSHKHIQAAGKEPKRHQKEDPNYGHW